MKAILKYVKCEYCNNLTDINDNTVTHREAAEPIWVCPDCENEEVLDWLAGGHERS